MYFSYFDESGDDGFPKYSSELFVLTSIYFNYQYWKINHQKIYEFRKNLKEEFSFPFRQEFHTKEFLQGKPPYRELNLKASSTDPYGVVCYPK